MNRPHRPNVIGATAFLLVASLLLAGSVAFCIFVLFTTPHIVNGGSLLAALIFVGMCAGLVVQTWKHFCSEWGYHRFAAKRRADNSSFRDSRV